MEVDNKLKIIENNYLPRKLSKQNLMEASAITFVKEITATKASVKASGIWLAYCLNFLYPNPNPTPIKRNNQCTVNQVVQETGEFATLRISCCSNVFAIRIGNNGAWQATQKLHTASKITPRQAFFFTVMYGVTRASGSNPVMKIGIY